MATMTVFITDSDRPWPLIYTVNVEDPGDDDEILAAVTAAREEDLEADEHGELTLLFAYEGELPAPFIDWRD